MNLLKIDSLAAVTILAGTSGEGRLSYGITQDHHIGIFGNQFDGFTFSVVCNGLMLAVWHEHHSANEEDGRCGKQPGEYRPTNLATALDDAGQIAGELTEAGLYKTVLVNADVGAAKDALQQGALILSTNGQITFERAQPFLGARRRTTQKLLDGGADVTI